MSMIQKTVDKAHEVVAKAEKMTSVSPIAIQLIKMVEDPAVGRQQIADTLGLDEVLAANVFKYGNSAAVGARKPFRSIVQVVDYVGFNTIKNIALFIAARNSITDKKLWFRTVFVSIATKRFCGMIDQSVDATDEAYMLALFHNLGSLVFKLFYEEEFKICQAESGIHHRLALETMKFGINHLELSATLLNKWGFPNNVIQQILFQVDYHSHKYTKANAMVELARRLYEVQNGDDAEINKNDLQKALAADDFTKVMAKHGLDKLDISVDLLYGLTNAAESSSRA